MCRVEWCNNKPNPSGNGYCRTHYDQMRKYGKILDKRTTRNPNDIIKHEDYAEIILRNRKGEEVARAIIDLEDVELARKYKWSLHTNGYVRCRHDGRTKFLHRIVLGAKDDEEIDHINLNKLDNRKSNLRKCEHHQNCFNRRSINRGIRKIMNRKLSKPYCVTITVKGRSIHLGYFSTYEEALKARLEAEKKYHGAFRCVV